MHTSDASFGYHQVGPGQCQGITVLLPRGSAGAQVVVSGTESSALIEGSDLEAFRSLLAQAQRGGHGTVPCHEGYYSGPQGYLRAEASSDGGVFVFGGGGDWGILAENEEEPTARLSATEAARLTDLLTRLTEG